MSSKAKIVIIFASIALALLIAAGIVFGIYFSNREEYEIDEAASFDMGGIRAVDIDCPSGDIRFVASEEGKATLTGTVISMSEKQAYLDVRTQDGTLFIEAKYEYQFFNFYSNLDLTVYLPQDSMADLAIDCKSGNIDIADMQFGDMDIVKTSGNARFEDCTAVSMRYKSTSGNTDISNCNLGSIIIGSTSGDIRIAGAPGNITIDSTSGGVFVDDVDGALNISSTSGDVSIGMADADIEPVSVQVTSGDVRLSMPSSAAFDLKARTTSGDIESAIDITMEGKLGEDFGGDDVRGSANGGGPLISVKTTSGDIRIVDK